MIIDLSVSQLGVDSSQSVLVNLMNIKMYLINNKTYLIAIKQLKPYCQSTLKLINEIIRVSRWFWSSLILDNAFHTSHFQ